LATRLELRSRLKRRLGLGVVSSVEDERLSEAINSGISRALSDGVPGMVRVTMTARVFGDIALTSVTVTQYSQEITTAGSHLQQNHIAPGDILVVVEADGTEHKFLIANVHGNHSVHIGAPAAQSITGGSSSYIKRRSLHLPSSGQVIRVIGVERHRRAELVYDPLAAATVIYETGEPRYFEQRFDEFAPDESMVVLYPAPDSDREFVVQQSGAKLRLTTDSDELNFTEEVLDAILERARDCYLVWSGAANQNDHYGSTRALRDVSDSLKNSANAVQIHTKI
jgi:hypothetical protein